MEISQRLIGAPATPPALSLSPSVCFHLLLWLCENEGTATRGPIRALVVSQSARVVLGRRPGSAVTGSPPR